ncbi:MAG: hypothetical protein K0U78_15420 [Actinomycetia bacterium]|nr:hypothetical protein [Actinomycetes bacterium]
MFVGIDSFINEISNSEIKRVTGVCGSVLDEYTDFEIGELSKEEYEDCMDKIKLAILEGELKPVSKPPLEMTNLSFNDRELILIKRSLSNCLGLLDGVEKHEQFLSEIKPLFDKFSKITFNLEN